MRVLMWNIQSFTMSRINDNRGANSVERAASAEKSLANTMYIVDTVREADPDIFVVLEARTGQGPVAQLATGNGPAGLIHLLAELREWNSANWYLVPPLRVNPPDPLAIATHTETVGVYWRDDRLQFTGPFVWPGGANNATGPPIPPGGAPGAAYPPPWNAVVPPGTTAAAWCRFYNNGNEILFNDNVHRRPYLTIFRERAGAQRIINLFSVHLKPGVNAQTAASRLSGIPGAPGAGQFTLVAGDFNINLAAPTMLQLAALQLWGPGWANYGRISPAGQAPTMIEANPAALPGAYLRNFCLDFGFIRYAAGQAPPIGQGPVTGVVDRVAGTAAVAPLPLFTKDMVQALGTIAGIVDPAEQARVFRTRWNYGHISPPAPGTSDHLPILMQV